MSDLSKRLELLFDNQILQSILRTGLICLIIGERPYMSKLFFPKYANLRRYHSPGKTDFTPVKSMVVFD
jgi:hypothetical protein